MRWGTDLADRRLWAGVAVVVIAVAVLIWLAVAPRPPDVATAPGSMTPPSGSMSPSAGHTSRPTRRPSPTPTASQRPTVAPTATPSPTPTPAAGALADGRLTLLVLGSDSDTSRRAAGKSYLTDAITLVSVAADGSRVALFSLPRDSSDIPMPDGSVWGGKANAIAPTLGPAAMRDAMSLLFGVPIDHYAMVDMDGFRQIVDAVGGVSVSTPYALVDKRCAIGPGTHYVDGSLALCFARHRAVDTDYARADRHQQLLLALRDQILANGIDLATLAGAIGSLQTDVPQSDIGHLVELARATAGAEVQRVVFGMEYMTFAGMAGTRGWISVPNVAAIRSTVSAVAPGATVDEAPADGEGEDGGSGGDRARSRDLEIR